MVPGASWSCRRGAIRFLCCLSIVALTLHIQRGMSVVARREPWSGDGRRRASERYTDQTDLIDPHLCAVSTVRVVGLRLGQLELAIHDVKCERSGDICQMSHSLGDG